MPENNYLEIDNESFSEYNENNNLINTSYFFRSPDPYNDFNPNEFSNNSNNSINDESQNYINFNKSEQNTINEADIEVEGNQKKKEKISDLSNSKLTGENSFLSRINQVTQKKENTNIQRKWDVKKEKSFY